MAVSVGGSADEPMMEMNTTPLIDVMLVLLIMFIIGIPVATHAVNIDLPAPSDVPQDVILDPIKNKVVLTRANEILWNGESINDGQLRTLLSQSMNLPVEPELQFEPEEYASYELAAQVLTIIRGSGVTRFGFVGNEKYRQFDKGPDGVNPTVTAR